MSNQQAFEAAINSSTFFSSEVLTVELVSVPGLVVAAVGLIGLAVALMAAAFLEAATSAAAVVSTSAASFLAAATLLSVACFEAEESAAHLLTVAISVATGLVVLVSALLCTAGDVCK